MTPPKASHLQPLLAGTTHALATLLETHPRIATHSSLSEPSLIQKVKPPHLYPTPETSLMCIDSLLGLLSSYYANEEYIQRKPILKEGWNKLQSLLNEKERVLINKTLPTEIYYQIVKTHNLTQRTAAESSTSSSTDSSVPLNQNPDTRKRLRPPSSISRSRIIAGSRKRATQTQTSLSSSSLLSSSSDSSMGKSSMGKSSEGQSDFEVDDGDRVCIDDELQPVPETGKQSDSLNRSDPRTFSFETDHSDAELHQHLSDIVVYINQMSPSIIIPAFRYILQSLFHTGGECWIDSLETLLKSRLSRPFASCISSFISEMTTLSNGSDPEKLYYQLVNILCSAVISESSCERGLGKAKSISTKTRSNLRAEVLNAILLAS